MELGNSMVAQDHYAKDEVAEKNEHLQNEWAKMNDLWGKKKADYDQCMQLQVFNRDIEQMEAVMVQQEVRYIYQLHLFSLPLGFYSVILRAITYQHLF